MLNYAPKTMSKSKDTQEEVLLFIVISIAVGLIVGGFWWASRKKIGNIDLIGDLSLQTETSVAQDGSRTYNFSQVKNVPSGLFNYGGSTTWAPIRKTADPVIQSTRKEYRLRYTSPINANPGSGTGIKMLLNGQLSFSQSSRPVKDQEYAQAKQRGYSLKQVPVAIDGIAIGVHPDLEIAGLTLDQLKEIYTGKILNWKEVDGPDIPITPYSRKEEEGGTVSFFAENILGEDSFGENVVFVQHTTDGIRQVSTNVGGIYYATATEIVPQCGIKSLPIGRFQDELINPYQKPFVPLDQCPQKRNRINKEAFQSGKYPITRRLFVIIKQDGQTDESAGSAYANFILSEQGQNLVDKAGFVRIK